MKFSIVLSLSFSIIFIVLMNNVFAISSVSVKYEEPTSDKETEILRWIKSLPSQELLIESRSLVYVEANPDLDKSATNKLASNIGAKTRKNAIENIVSMINNSFKLEHSIALVIGSGRVGY
jgi:hypothetical protein